MTADEQKDAGGKAGRKKINRLLDRLSRTERRRLVASLFARLGPRHLDLAEDVVQEAITSAMLTWPYRGIPENPTAWLSRVAGNKAIDILRKRGREVEGGNAEETSALANSSNPAHGEAETVIEVRVTDPALRLIFLCCHDALSQRDQLMMTLRISSGFTAREIARLFLMTENAVAQRLARARRTLADLEGDLAEAPSRFQLEERRQVVLKTIYLMFSAAYMPGCEKTSLQFDMAAEALRLARLVADDPESRDGSAGALVALLCFQLGRFTTRVNAEGGLCLLKDQDRGRWDRSLFHLGTEYLLLAKVSELPGRYHIEAAIAALHAGAANWAETDWQAIRKLYDQLTKIVQSPVAGIGRAVAMANCGAVEEGLEALQELRVHGQMANYVPWHLARAEIMTLSGEIEGATTALQEAEQLATSPAVLDHIETRLLELT